MAVTLVRHPSLIGVVQQDTVVLIHLKDLTAVRGAANPSLEGAILMDIVAFIHLRNHSCETCGNYLLKRAILLNTDVFTMGESLTHAPHATNNSLFLSILLPHEKYP